MTNEILSETKSASGGKTVPVPGDTGNFLILDQETTNLLLMLAKIHPYGNKTVLKIILKLYIRLARYCRKKGTDPVEVLGNIVEKQLVQDFEGFQIKRIKWISDLIERSEEPVTGKEADITEDISELKTLVRRLQSSVEVSKTVPPLESFRPKGPPKLMPLDQKPSPANRQDYRDLRNKKRPRKIEF